MEIDSCFLPLALHGAFRHVPQGSDLGKRESAKELQVYDFRQYWFGLCEFIKSVADLSESLIIQFTESAGMR